MITIFGPFFTGSSTDSLGTISGFGSNMDTAKVLIALVASAIACWAIFGDRLITGVLSIGKLIVG
ncbi:7404_t:CDS:2, partial [Gigaspora margarita]